MFQSASKTPSEDCVRPLPPIRTIIFDSTIIDETVLSKADARYHVCFAPQICLKQLSGFQFCRRLLRIEIPVSVEIIDLNAFFGCHSLTEVIFPGDSRLRRLNGFQSCTQLSRIQIPASVQIITSSAFFGCNSLQEVIFATDGRLRILSGFQSCTQLFRIAIPASVEIITSSAFFGCNSLQEVIFATEEFKTVARLLVKGRTLDDIRAIHEKENLLKAKTAYRGKTVFSALAARFKAIPPEFLDLFEKTDVSTQKLIAAIATMAADSLFFDFMSEVYREKLLIGEKTLAASDFVQFFRNKQVQDEKAASWKDITFNRLGRAYRNVLLQSGLIELPGGKPNSKKAEWLVRKPIVNKQLAELLQKTNRGAFYSALTGEDQ
jgi:hypothetical protein